MGRAGHPALHHRLAQLAERDLFDLPDALSADAELLAELTQRRLAPVEAEARADDPPLTLVEDGKRAGSCSSSSSSGMRSKASLARGSSSSSPSVMPASWSPPTGSSSARGLRSAAIRLSTCCARQADRRRNRGEAGLAPVALQVLALGVLDPRELAQRAVGHHDRPAQLGDELLHRLAHPPRCVHPKRRAHLRIETLERPQQPNDAFLHELGAVDLRTAAIDPRDAADQRHEGLHELLALGGPALLGGQHELSLGCRREPVTGVPIRAVGAVAQTAVTSSPARADRLAWSCQWRRGHRDRLSSLLGFKGGGPIAYPPASCGARFGAAVRAGWPETRGGRWVRCDAQGVSVDPTRVRSHPPSAQSG